MSNKVNVLIQGETDQVISCLKDTLLESVTERGAESVEQFMDQKPEVINSILQKHIAAAYDEIKREFNTGGNIEKKKPEYVFNGLINVPDIKIEYRGYTIIPKRDFGGQTYQSCGCVYSKGYVVIGGPYKICNVMPGACWFHTVIEAKSGIDTLIESQETGKNFWEIDYEKRGLNEWAEV